MMGKAPTVHERSVSEDHWAVVPEGEGLFSGDAGRRVDMVQLLWQTRPLGRETVPEAQCGRHDVGMIGRMSNEVYGAKKEKSYASSITDRISSCQKENIASSGLRAHMSRSGRGVAKSREPIWPRGRARLRTPERQILWAKIDFLLGHLSELNRKATIRWPTAGDALAAKNATPPLPVVTTAGARALYPRRLGTATNDQKLLQRNATEHVRKIGCISMELVPKLVQEGTGSAAAGPHASGPQVREPPELGL